MDSRALPNTWGLPDESATTLLPQGSAPIHKQENSKQLELDLDTSKHNWDVYIKEMEIQGRCPQCSELLPISWRGISECLNCNV